jgi:UDP:flavonoid glycosyltransferase YjiC (YdhE family)
MPQQHPATNPPQILVTLGSTFTNDEAFFRIAAESALLAAARAHIVTGKRTPHILNALHQAPPGPATISQWIDYTQEFPHLSGIVHHGGMATTHSALIHGIPQIVIPHAGDQFPQAARVTQARVGYGIKAQDFTMQNAPILLTDILWAPDFAEKARTMARHLHTLGGIPRAAQAIETLGNIS